MGLIGKREEEKKDFVFVTCTTLLCGCEMKC